MNQKAMNILGMLYTEALTKNIWKVPKYEIEKKCSISIKELNFYLVYLMDKNLISGSYGKDYEKDIFTHWYNITHSGIDIVESLR